MTNTVNLFDKGKKLTFKIRKFTYLNTRFEADTEAPHSRQDRKTTNQILQKKTGLGDKV